MCLASLCKFPTYFCCSNLGLKDFKTCYLNISRIVPDSNSGNDVGFFFDMKTHRDPQNVLQTAWRAREVPVGKKAFWSIFVPILLIPKVHHRISIRHSNPKVFFQNLSCSDQMLFYQVSLFHNVESFLSFILYFCNKSMAFEYSVYFL